MSQVYLAILLNVFLLLPAGQSTAQLSKKFDKIKTFIPATYEILDVEAGDMNEDGFDDYALVLRNENEDKNGDELRPLLLVMGSKSGRLNLMERNDSIVLCRNCGGVFGDPFQGVTIKDGVLLIEHNVGGSWRWSRNISFRYDAALEEFVLDSDVAGSYQQYKSNQIVFAPKKDNGNKLLFKSYSFCRNR